MRVVIGRGKVKVEIDDGVQDMLLRAVREGMPRTLRVIEEEIDRIYADAVARWPIGRERSGPAERGRPHSRDLMTKELLIDPGAEASASGRIGNSAPYAYYITSRRIGEATELTAVEFDANGQVVQRGSQVNPWQVLVRRPTLEAIPRMTAALAAEIRDVMGGS